MASRAATVGDPKRPQEVKKVGAVVVPPADDSMCFTLLVTGLFMGAFALLFQSKLLVWSGVFMTLAAYTHMPYDSQNVMQLLVMVITIIGWAGINVYFRPWLMSRHESTPPPFSTIQD